MQPTQWDLFCRVIDNFGDVGVCWRLAADLAARGESVRLWVDDASALRWMAPQGAAGVVVLPWPLGNARVEPGDVVIEAFGCELPESFLGRMVGAHRPPAWINLEYLTAEPFAERTHRMPSPQFTGPGAGLKKWFYYPGFTPRTGGLIRESNLQGRQNAFSAHDWLARHAATARPDERVVSLFCYDQPALDGLLDQLANRPTLLLATAGHAARQVNTLLGPSLRRGALRALLLPAMPQNDYDHLLWASDINFVRGEDSFVRAQWSGKPFVWQAYPQHDDAHLEKLDAFLTLFLEGADEALSTEVSRVWRAWNTGSRRLPAWPQVADWERLCAAWHARLLLQPDLTTQLLSFAAETR